MTPSQSTVMLGVIMGIVANGRGLRGKGKTLASLLGKGWVVEKDGVLRATESGKRAFEAHRQKRGSK